MKRALKRFWKIIVAPGKSTEGLNGTERRLAHILVFLARFCLFALPLWIIAIFGIRVYWLQALTARLAAALLAVIGYGATFVASVSEGIAIPGVVLGGKTIGIVWDCVGWKSMLAYLALVFAVPGVDWKLQRRALWFIPVLLVINILRVATVVLVGYRWPHLFGLVHALLWQWGLVAVVLVGWVWWLNYLQYCK